LTNKNSDNKENEYYERNNNYGNDKGNIVDGDWTAIGFKNTRVIA